MTTEVFNKLVKSPTSITDAELKQLEVLVWNAPYCQIANILVAKGYFDRDDVLKDRKLKTAATVATSRKKLKNLLFLPKETTTITVKEDKKTFIEPKSEFKPIPESETKSTESENTPEAEEDLTNELEQNIQLLKSLRKSAKKETPETQELKKTTPTSNKAKKVSSDKKKTPTKPSAKKPAVKKSSTSKSKTKNPSETKTTVKKAQTKKQPQKSQPKNKASIQEVINDEITVYSSRLGDIVEEEITKAESNGDGDFLLDYLENIKNRKKPVEKKSQDDIINNFIEKDPSIGKLDKHNKFSENDSNDLSKRSYEENTKLVSENLAKINIRQGNISKAISIYESLILKNPQKKTYFAKQIEKLSKK